MSELREGTNLEHSTAEIRVPTLTSPPPNRAVLPANVQSAAATKDPLPGYTPAPLVAFPFMRQTPIRCSETEKSLDVLVPSPPHCLFPLRSRRCFRQRPCYSGQCSRPTARGSIPQGNPGVHLEGLTPQFNEHVQC